MGIDVEPGCENSPCFSVVLIDNNNNLIYTQTKVPLHRLIRLVWEYRPSILATDNIFEIAHSHYDLIRVLSLLPDDLKIVQVTRQPNGEYIDVRELARREKIELKPGKPYSLQTAHLIALLASKGYGSIVKFVDEKTRIIVTRSRQAKQGGMSRARYQRRIRTMILRTTKEIRKLLDRSKLDYDLLFRKSSGGLESATFIVYAPRSKVREIVKEYKDRDIKVVLKPVYTSKVLFEPTRQISKQKPYIIVGIDPGISTGIAAITLDGRLVTAYSKRGIDRADVINIITEYGTPVLIAADVKPASEFVKKIAAILNVPVFEPPVQLSAAEKRYIVEEYVKSQGINSITDPHIRDALAAAVKALNSFSPKFRQIESYLDRIGIPNLDREGVKVLVVKGATIAEALEEAIKKTLQRSSIQQRTVKLDTVKQKHDHDLQKKFIDEIEKLRAENITLRKKLKEAEETIKRLEQENKLFRLELNENIERDRKIYTLMHRIEILDDEISKLRETLEKYQEQFIKLKKLLLGVYNHQIIPAIRITNIDNTILKQLTELRNSYGRIAIILENVNATQLNKYVQQLKDITTCILASKHYEDLKEIVENYNLPLLPLEEYIVEDFEEIVFVNYSALIDAKIRQLEIEYSKKQSKGLDKEKLKEIIESYREERKKIFTRLLGSKHG